MRVSGAVQPALWLLTGSSLLCRALAEPSTPVNALRDALTTSALPPVHAADIPPVDPGAWALLLEHARQAVQSEAQAPQTGEGIRVVRETFFVPMGAKVGESHAGTGAATLAGVDAHAKEEQRQVEAADIVKTVGKLRVLRPVFIYAVHHPLRFLYSYALLPLLSLVLALVRAAAILLSVALSPLSFLLSTLVLRPLAHTTALLAALAPLWYALIAALVSGAGCGALAGLVAGRTTRTALEDATRTARRAARWLGLLPKETLPSPVPGGFGAGAVLERFAPAPAAVEEGEPYGAVARGHRLSDKVRSKVHAFDDEASKHAAGLYASYSDTDAVGVGRDDSPSGEDEDDAGASDEWESGADAVPLAAGAGGAASGWRGRKVAW